MPTIIKELSHQTGLNFHGKVKWEELINSKAYGFYVVAMTDYSEKLVCMDTPNFNNNAIKQWIELVKSSGKQINIDNKIADLESIKERLAHFWYPDETVLYIGKAGPTKNRTLKKRVKKYYETKLGCDGKHAGGHWINTLHNLSSCNIYYSEYTGIDIADKEEQLISYFMNNVSDTSKENLFDKLNCYPFANKELYRKSLKTKIKKEHGLNNQTIDCGNIWRK